MSTPELIAMLTRVDATTRKWKLSKNRADEMDAWDAIAALDKHSVDLAREVAGLRSTEAVLRTSLIDQDYALSQTLGRALNPDRETIRKHAEMMADEYARERR